MSGVNVVGDCAGSSACTTSVKSGAVCGEARYAAGYAVASGTGAVVGADDGSLVGEMCGVSAAECGSAGGSSRYVRSSSYG